MKKRYPTTKWIIMQGGPDVWYLVKGNGTARGEVVRSLTQESVEAFITNL